jgi:thiol-disulfide isomerase/thioredoxin
MVRRVRRQLTLLLLCATVATLRDKGLCAEETDEVKKILAQGDLFASRRKYELALDAYHKADKLAHHSSAAAYLKLAAAERKLGDFSAALDDSKKAAKAAGENKDLAVEAHLQRATLLTQMAGKASDKKLREAEEELRQALLLLPDKALTHFDLGVVLLKQERDGEGIPELQLARSSNRLNQETAAEAEKYIASPIRARTPFAPDFSFTTRESTRISNSALRGKVVLLDFWGTWCPPCRESVPVLKGINKKYAGKAFQLIGVSSDDDEDVWRTFIESQKMDWAEYIDLSGNVLHAFRVESFPTYVVLDKDGVIRFRQSGLGPTTENDLEEAIGRALKKEADPKLAAALAGPANDQPPKTALGGGSNQPAAGQSPAAVKREPQIEGEYSGNVYKNRLLGMTYQLPAGWIPAKPDELHTLNQKSEASAKAAVLEQHPELADRLKFIAPQLVLYASRLGEGDGQRLAAPCLRITAYPTRVDSLELSGFRRMLESLALAQGLKAAGEAQQLTVNGHGFLRADFERTAGDRHVYQSFVQTLGGDFLLSIEFYGTSKEEMLSAAESLKAMVIQDADE